jgi:DNA-binding NarL/FixJ family response regulator
MVVLVQATVLTVGLNGRSEVIKELPVRLIKMQSGVEAARSLKNEKVNSVISRWDLDDMPDGRFLKSFKAAKPYVPTIALVRPGSKAQEIAARALGVTAVLAEDATDAVLRDTVANLLGIEGAVDIKAISSADNVEELMREG